MIPMNTDCQAGDKALENTPTLPNFNQIARFNTLNTNPVNSYIPYFNAPYGLLFNPNLYNYTQTDHNQLIANAAENTSRSERITRSEFVKIATKLILKVRKDIKISNQKSGYMTYHKEIKDNNYFEGIRDIINKNERKNNYSIFYNAELVKFAKMGNCNELADLLCAKLAKKLKRVNTKATIRIVYSKEIDHVYLLVRIALKGEKKSLWELDAWDPRIIDRSRRADKTIKNKEMLSYGTHTSKLYRIKIDPDDLKNTFEKCINEQRNNFFRDIKQKIQAPKKGRSANSPTPERMITKKHLHIHPDYTIDKAYDTKKLPGFFDDRSRKKVKLEYGQKMSTWQVEQN